MSHLPTLGYALHFQTCQSSFLRLDAYICLTSAAKGYGERMVRAVVSSIPEDWKAVVVMDWSGGFWGKMANKYDKIVIL